MKTIDSNELYEVLAETPAEQNIMLAGKHFFYIYSSSSCRSF